MTKRNDPDATVAPFDFLRKDTARSFSNEATLAPNGSSSFSKKVDLDVGRVIKNRFELCEEIGHGGMGVVYRARDLRKVEARDPDPFVAIKFLSEELAGFDRGFIALQREAKHAQTLNHPNIVKVFDFDRDGSLVFLTMELLQGQSLQQRLRELPSRPMGKVERLHIARGVLAGMSYAHAREIAHSDLKPSNIMLCAGDEAKILDFGIARRKNHDEVFDADDLGALTVDYASPEMLAHSRPTPADDVFALGCLLFSLYDGRHPFDHLRADEARDRGTRPIRPATCSRMHWRSICRALAFRRANRFETAAQLTDAFEAHDWQLIAATGAIVIALVIGMGWLSSDRIQSSIARARLSAEDKSALAAYLSAGSINLAKSYYEDAADKFIAALTLDAHNGDARGGIENVLRELKGSVSPAEFRERVVALAERTNCTYENADCPESVRTLFADTLAKSASPAP